MNAYVEHGRKYEGVEAFQVQNPLAQRFIPGRTVGIAPAHEEGAGWRAILAGYDAAGNAYVVPLSGHFGELRARKVPFAGAGTGSMFLSVDEPSGRDEADWHEAKTLALSIAMAFGLEGRA